MTRADEHLRERTRRAVRLQVAETAMQLFVEHGFDATTVEQVADVAGMSRSSFFRYFATKEDVMLEALGDAHREIVVALAERPENESPWLALRRSFDGLAADTEAHRDKARILIAMLFQTPALRRAHAYRSAGWADLVAEELTASGRVATNHPGRLQAAALAAAALACLEIAQRAWATDEHADAFADVLDITMRAVAPID